jgi:adenosylmethionine-8-amino-7-oxononanoate aminotransferase
MADLIARDRAHLWHPYTQMQVAPPPLPVVRGEGVYLYTEDGRRILDGISSWWVNIHGHSHPVLNRALADQAARLEHVMFAGCTHPPAVELAERLVAILPRGLTRVFYSDNGSTAVEVALKMAWQYWRNRGHAQRRTFIGLQHAYHGDTVGAMSASAGSVFTDAFQPLLFPIVRALAEPSLGAAACLDDLERHLRERGDSVAAVIVEPMIQGAGGMIMWTPDYLAGVRELCTRYGTLLIADEVLTGFGRTGRMFACEHANVSPDIICLSKALTAGYLPLGATVATEQIYDAFLSDDRRRTFFHGHSFTANPLACAVAIASLDLFARDRTLERVVRLEGQMRERLLPLASLPSVADVRVMGGVAALQLVEPATARRGASTFAPGATADKSHPGLQNNGAGGYLDTIGPRLAAAFLERGLLLRPLGNVLYFMPPYVIEADAVEWAAGQIGEVLSADA